MKIKRLWIEIFLASAAGAAELIIWQRADTDPFTKKRGDFEPEETEETESLRGAFFVKNKTVLTTDDSDGHGFGVMGF